MNIAAGEGTVGSWHPIVIIGICCPKCRGGSLRYRNWKSDCGGRTNQQIECNGCGNMWWAMEEDE